MSEPLVYLTDSSWSVTGRHSGRRYHHPHPDDSARPACGVGVLCDESGQLLFDLPPELVCERPGCSKRTDIALDPGRAVEVDERVPSFEHDRGVGALEVALADPNLFMLNPVYRLGVEVFFRALADAGARWHRRVLRAVL